ncbi:MAG: META domain-containing protein [Pseudomonadota bacterium]
MRFAVFAGVAALLAACAPTDITKAPPPPPEQIGDVDWRLVGFRGSRVPEEAFIADLSGGFISGDGPCNRINGNYLGTGEVFLVETVVTTRSTCDDLDLEKQIIEGLLSVEAARVDDGVLFLFDENDSPIMSFLPYYPPAEPETAPS